MKEPVEATAKRRMINIQGQRKDLFGDLGGDAKDVVIISSRLQPHRLFELGSGMVTHVHGGVDSEQEKTHPQ